MRIQVSKNDVSWAWKLELGGDEYVSNHSFRSKRDAVMDLEGIIEQIFKKRKE